MTSAVGRLCRAACLALLASTGAVKGAMADSCGIRPYSSGHVPPLRLSATISGYQAEQQAKACGDDDLSTTLARVQHAADLSALELHRKAAEVATAAYAQLERLGQRADVNKAEMLGVLGNARLAEGEWELAGQIFDRAIVLRTDHAREDGQGLAQAYLGRGRARLGAGRVREALDDLNAAARSAGGGGEAVDIFVRAAAGHRDPAATQAGRRILPLNVELDTTLALTLDASAAGRGQARRAELLRGPGLHWTGTRLALDAAAFEVRHGQPAEAARYAGLALGAAGGYGEDHPLRAHALVLRAVAQTQSSGTVDPADLAAAREAVTILEPWVTGARAMASEPVARQQSRETLANAIGLVERAAQAGRLTTGEAAAETLGIAQLAISNDGAGAATRLMARLSVGSDEKADLVRHIEELGHQVREAEQRLLLHRLAGDTERARLAVRELEGLRGEERELSDRADELLPDLASLVRQLPVSVKDMQGVLAPGEGLVVFLSGETGGWAWLVTARSVRSAAVRADAATLRALVGRVRDGADPARPGRRPFDVEAASRLHGLLFGELAGDMQGLRHLYLVPDADLQPLPFALLLREPVAAGRLDPGSAPWLVRQHSLSVLPSPAALVGLSRAKPYPPRPEPLLGVGKPLLVGPAAGETLVTSPFSVRGGVPVASVLSLRPLDETGHELARIAKALGANEEHLLLGREATKDKLLARPLSHYRVVAFATHGLLGGELPNLRQPALVLTPPAVADADGDAALLTAAELAALPLRADWLILSACNTGRSAGGAGYRFSSLASSGLYAGSRSIMASHWAVVSDATVELIAGTLEKAADGKSPPGALREMMLHLASLDAGNLSDPAIWGAFFVVGLNRMW